MAGGFSSTTIMIGFFAISEILGVLASIITRSRKTHHQNRQDPRLRHQLQELIRNTRLLIQSTIIVLSSAFCPYRRLTPAR
jgi:TctA family transporter